MREYMYALLGWNILVFLIYGLDKSKAKGHKQRISERTLLLLAFLMGALGALCGMAFFRHKTKHTKFKIGVPIALIVNIVIIYFVSQIKI